MQWVPGFPTSNNKRQTVEFMLHISRYKSVDCNLQIVAHHPTPPDRVSTWATCNSINFSIQLGFSREATTYNTNISTGK